MAGKTTQKRLSDSARKLLAEIAGMNNPTSHEVYYNAERDAAGEELFGFGLVACGETYQGQDPEDQGCYVLITERGHKSLAKARAAGLV